MQKFILQRTDSSYGVSNIEKDVNKELANGWNVVNVRIAQAEYTNNHSMYTTVAVVLEKL